MKRIESLTCQIFKEYTILFPFGLVLKDNQQPIAGVAARLHSHQAHQRKKE